VTAPVVCAATIGSVVLTAIDMGLLTRMTG
jgi:hypothetical protein